MAVSVEHLAETSGAALDPITIEMLWSRLISIVEESESTLVRTSFSPVVGEADDHSAALLDADGNLLAQTPSAMPAFIGILEHTTKVMLEHFPAETLQRGDVLVTNDPWICCGHLNDVNVLRPIFYRDRLVAFAANTAHLTDIGGRNSAEAVDLFEEGLRILPSKLVKAGEENEEIFKFLRANSRIPDQMIGDLHAQLAATETADARLVEMLEEYGLDDLRELSGEIISRTETAMRAAIRALPDGDYCAMTTCDGIRDPIEIHVTVSVRGDEVLIDYTGTSKQVRFGINCPLSLTYAESVWPIRVALAPDIPTNSGSLRPITVTAPDGCILNPRFPAPVLARTVIVHHVHEPIFEALSSLVPTHIDPARVQANTGTIWTFNVQGEWGEGKRPSWETSDRFVIGYIGNGGQGASGAQDGRFCMSYPDNCSNTPIEVMESRAPILFLSKALRTDSGGAGEFRGGAGQEILLEILGDEPFAFSSGCSDRIVNPPLGLNGGEPGATGFLAINGSPIRKQVHYEVKTGDIVTWRSPGGGGYGDPRQRDPEAVRRDVAYGIVSPEQARTVYQVPIDLAELNGL